MKNLENILKILEISADDFDIEIFSEEFMSIPFQIKEIDKNISRLTDYQYTRYFKAIGKIKMEALKAKPTNELNKNIIQSILETINDELKVA
jgi:predicted RNA-binding protein Jag